MSDNKNEQEFYVPIEFVPQEHLKYRAFYEGPKTIFEAVKYIIPKICPHCEAELQIDHESFAQESPPAPKNRALTEN